MTCPYVSELSFILIIEKHKLVAKPTVTVHETMSLPVETQRPNRIFTIFVFEN